MMTEGTDATDPFCPSMVKPVKAMHGILGLKHLFKDENPGIHNEARDIPALMLPVVTNMSEACFPIPQCALGMTRKCIGYQAPELQKAVLWPNA